MYPRHGVPGDVRDLLAGRAGALRDDDCVRESQFRSRVAGGRLDELLPVLFRGHQGRTLPPVRPSGLTGFGARRE